MKLRQIGFILMVSVLLIIDSSAMWASTLVTEQPLVIGKHLSFQSSILNEDRQLNIYLPASYQEKPGKNYPVIYLLDGSLDEDFIHISGLVQFASFSWIKMMPESIVVGIANSDRKHDFTSPTKNKKDKSYFQTSGGSAKFIDFLGNELQPLIQSKFRISKEATIVGQSLGGLLATEILFNEPDLFDNYIIVSPSLWWNDEYLLKQSTIQSLRRRKVFIAVGDEGPIMIGTAEKLYQKLTRLHDKPYQLGFKFLKQQNHGDALHLAAYQGFQFMFSKDQNLMKSKTGD